jgi:hypothetical protein
LVRGTWHIYLLDMTLTRNITYLPLLIEVKNNMLAVAVVFVSVMSTRLLKE